MNKAIVDNLMRAIDVIEAAPEERLDLRAYKQKTDCGTLYCAAGFLTQDPHFAKFMRLKRRTGTPMHKFTLTGNNKEQHGDTTFLNAHLGENATWRLFSGQGWGQLDNDILEHHKSTDKDLAIDRLVGQLFTELSKEET